MCSAHTPCRFACFTCALYKRKDPAPTWERTGAPGPMPSLPLVIPLFLHEGLLTFALVRVTGPCTSSGNSRCSRPALAECIHLRLGRRGHRACVSRRRGKRGVSISSHHGKHAHGARRSCQRGVRVMQGENRVPRGGCPQHCKLCETEHRPLLMTSHHINPLLKYPRRLQILSESP